MASIESHNIRRSCMKEHLVGFKNDLNSSLSCLKKSIDQKFNSNWVRIEGNTGVGQIEGNIRKILQT